MKKKIIASLVLFMSMVAFGANHAQKFFQMNQM